ncbi:DUF805 domain-containing protein [Vibrio ostreicida]|uniref:DUF805 domain-containing protein n=1 Tax=Vibrio ostreicida TaxID=526588 RepID=A0ABT8C2L2_9VIBR|nr:DUF805 domain-containing protein [Vibrio ostreicida]MDN3612577.1 DUF805 domain-containing protein [Vibrio ostreicida]NPD09197.1 DUF805 domain-containing protein [Vibrio ostreicida]
MLFYFLAWKRSLDFSGHSSRKEFWVFILGHALVTIGCITADIMMDMVIWFGIIYDVVSVIPMLSAIVRRLHDIGKSGYWGWVFFIPLFGPFLLIYWLVQPTNTQINGETFV